MPETRSAPCQPGLAGWLAAASPIHAFSLYLGVVSTNPTIGALTAVAAAAPWAAGVAMGIAIVNAIAAAVIDAPLKAVPPC